MLFGACFKHIDVSILELVLCKCVLCAHNYSVKLNYGKADDYALHQPLNSTLIT